ncbi:MAG: carbamoyltransferase HypF [Myxococcota bacterium]
MSELIRIRGTVQGVGFRPTVARLARELGLAGFVRNDADGVLIGLAADDASCSGFLESLLNALPRLAKVESVERTKEPVVAEGFRIVRSEDGAPATEVAPDAATCAACREEVDDPYARRFRYPFTSCTHCGPRYTIVERIPYDRPNTTMAGFPLCAECQDEYDTESDRRYHAQPLACFSCGPEAKLVRSDGRAFSMDRWSMHDDVDAVGGLLRSGEIVALKGLGGYQLACDATNPAAVDTLRARKRRPHKAFALMVRDLEVAAQYVVLSDADRALLTSPEAPIVLLPRREASNPARPVVDAVAPDQARLGIMLPTTPLHQLVMKRVDRPIVCTSGNVTDEPQCIDDDDAKARLGAIADWMLVHNRPIRNRVDDSVVGEFDGEHRVLRRARGYSPGPIALPGGFAEAAPLVAMGGEYKGAFALLSGGRAVLSPHLGDLDHPAAFAAYQDTFSLLSELYRHRPERVAFDAHTGYRTHEMGQGFARGRAIEAVEVVHHHAHIASCMAENGVPLSSPPILGLALDGLGLGPNGELWGGELLAADYRRFERLGTLKPVALLGGDAASRQPWRNLYAHLRAEMSWAELDMNFGDTEAIQRLKQKPVALLEQLLEGSAGPQACASSTGRLFDAVAAALGLAVEEIEYEGQAAMMLEAQVTEAALEEAAKEPYPFSLPRLPESFPSGADLPYIEPLAMWRALLGDLWAKVDPALIAARFHRGFADVLVRLVDQARGRTGIETVALSGGCFQNKVLLELVADGLRGAEFRVLTHRRVPPNDGGLALGQAAVAAARELEERKAQRDLAQGEVK